MRPFDVPLRSVEEQVLKKMSAHKAFSVAQAPNYVENAWLTHDQGMAANQFLLPSLGSLRRRAYLMIAWRVFVVRLV